MAAGFCSSLKTFSAEERSCSEKKIALWLENLLYLGMRYVQIFPEKLDNGIWQNEILIAGNGQDDLIRTVERVLARRVVDFEQGITVNVDGWILSQTEARFCAMLYLQSCGKMNS